MGLLGRLQSILPATKLNPTERLLATEESEAIKAIDGMLTDKRNNLFAALQNIVTSQYPSQLGSSHRDVIAAYDLYQDAANGKWTLNKKGKTFLKILMEKQN